MEARLIVPFVSKIVLENSLMLLSSKYRKNIVSNRPQAESFDHKMKKETQIKIKINS